MNLVKRMRFQEKKKKKRALRHKLLLRDLFELPVRRAYSSLILPPLDFLPNYPQITSA